MPIHEIQTKEYECSWCHYRWINRVNGKDGPAPNKCAKCKRSNWNKGWEEAISPEDNGLRRRIRRFGEYHYSYNGLPKDLPEKFLNIQPRPTHMELLEVVNPLHIPWPWGSSGYQYIDRVPDPDNPGYLRYNPNEYEKLLQHEQARRLELMIQIMKSRGMEYKYEYDPAHPITLLQWVAKLFTAGRKDNHPDDEIIGWINAYAKGQRYTDEQISHAINEYLSAHGQMKQGEAAKL